MIRAEVSARIREIGIIPAVRLHSAEEALFAARGGSGRGNTYRRSYRHRAGSAACDPGIGYQ